MFCPTCGVDSVEGLNYCKRCGANVTTALGEASLKKFPLPLTFAFLALIGLVFAMGLAFPLAAAHDLTLNGFSPRHLMVIFAGDLALTFLVVAMLIWLFLRLVRLNQHSGPARPDSFQNETFRPQISAPQSIGSVTEHTTRSFQPGRYDNE